MSLRPKLVTPCTPSKITAPFALKPEFQKYLAFDNDTFSNFNAGPENDTIWEKLSVRRNLHARLWWSMSALLTAFWVVKHDEY